MKKLLYVILIIILESHVAQSQVQRDNLSGNFYTIDYVFTGKVNPGLDSIFALRYKFMKQDFNRFNKVFIEGSSHKKIVNLKNILTNDSIEVQSDGAYSYIIIKKYDKEDIPLLTQGEDKNGQKQDFYIRYNDGNVRSPRQVKQMEQMNNVRIRQMKGGK